MLRNFSWEFSRPTSWECVCLLWVNFNLEDSIYSKYEIELFKEEFITIEERGNFGKFLWLKVRVKKNELMLNWEKFKD